MKYTNKTKFFHMECFRLLWNEKKTTLRDELVLLNRRQFVLFELSNTFFVEFIGYTKSDWKCCLENIHQLRF